MIKSQKSLKSVSILAILIVATTLCTSLTGLLMGEQVYGSEVMSSEFRPNDLLNLVIGLPMILVPLFFAQKGNSAGILLLPGAFLYTFYNNAAYLAAVPFGVWWVCYLVIEILAIAALINWFNIINPDSAKERLAGKVPDRFGGILLALFGLIFLSRALGTLIPGWLGQTAIPETEFPVLIADLILAPLWIIVGIALIRKTTFGYTAGAGWLFDAVGLFIALIFFLLIQPLMTDTPFSLVDVLVVLVMTLPFIFPFLRFLKAARHQE